LRAPLLSPSKDSERLESCPLRPTDVVDIATVDLVQAEIESGNESRRIDGRTTTLPLCSQIRVSFAW